MSDLEEAIMDIIDNMPEKDAKWLNGKLKADTEQRRELEQQNAELKEYATHKGCCDIVFNDDVTSSCSCGYDNLKEK